MEILKGKVAIITGAASGIGKRIAEKFAESKANLVLTDINDDIKVRAEELAKNYSISAIGLKHNVSIEQQCKEVVEKTIEIFKKIDILINNAGITRDGLAIKMKEEDFDSVISVNLKGPFLMSKHSFVYMSKQRSGKIVNISSIVGQTGQAGQANYSASKAGLIGLTKSLAREFARRNINVNAIAPGFIATKMTEKLDEKAISTIIQQIPLQRLGTVDDVANLALFLSSDESSYITGQVIGVNGGLYM
ncbi:MAG: 3-oxoacyl-[acyl-carrier-protein] reductase [Elusimicrobiota bacterium]